MSVRGRSLENEVALKHAVDCDQIGCGVAEDDIALNIERLADEHGLGDACSTSAFQRRGRCRRTRVGRVGDLEGLCSDHTRRRNGQHRGT